MKTGKSDNLSDSDLQCLECDLETYINGKGTEALWDFRSYGTVQNIASGSVHAKMAPEISDLLQNADLWQLLLKYCPHAKLRDSDIMKCLNALLKHNKACNPTEWPDSIFVTHLTKCLHIQLTHIRDMKRYPDRFTYRIQKLVPADYNRLMTLLSKVALNDSNVEQCKHESRQHASSKGSTAALISFFEKTNCQTKQKAS